MVDIGESKNNDMIVKLDKLRSKLHLIGIDFDYSVGILDGRISLEWIESKGLIELDMSKYGITSISGSDAFSKSDIRKILIDTDYTELNVLALGSAESLDTIVFSNKTIPAESCMDCESLENVIISHGTLDILEHHVFFGCKRLRNIDLSNIKVIGDYSLYESGIQLDGEYKILECIGKAALRGVAKIGKLKLPNIVTIGLSAFADSGIQSVEIGNKCELIDNYAFYGCEKLESVTIQKKCEMRIGEKPFIGCKKLKAVYIVDGSDLCQRISKIENRDSGLFGAPIACKFYSIDTKGKIIRQIR